MGKLFILILCLFTLSSAISAVTVQGIDIEFVTIDNPRNDGDSIEEADPQGCGAVDYIYSIGKYEITNAQWDAFVNAADHSQEISHHSWTNFGGQDQIYHSKINDKNTIPTPIQHPNYARP